MERSIKRGVDLVVKGKYILTINQKMDIFDNGVVVIDNNKIIDIGNSDLLNTYEAKEFIDTGNSIVMPGLINAHTHVAMTYFRGLADDLPLDEWLQKNIWPAEARYVNPEFVRKSSELGIVEMLKSGITCFNDMYFFGEESAEVVIRYGMRAVLGEAVIDFTTPSCKTPDDAFARTEEMNIKYKENELLNISVLPHSPYACSKENLIKSRDLANKLGIGIHIHIAETKKEYDDCIKNNGASPVKYLDDLGLLNEKTVAAHSIWLTDDDLDIYQKRGVKVAHCPISDMKLASGVKAFDKMLQRGITISLASDGAASNNTQDLFTDMRVCALLHKVSNQNPAIAKAEDIVRSATINGAISLGKEKEIGSLEIGKKADIITINLDKPHLLPIYNPYSHLVYAVNSGDVENVIIGGKMLMSDKKILNADEERIYIEAKKFLEIRKLGN